MDAITWRVQKHPTTQARLCEEVKNHKTQNADHYEKKKTGRISIFILTANRIFPTAPIESVISRNVCSSFISQTKVGGKKETEDKDLLYKERVWGGKFLKGSKCPLDQAAYSCSFY